MTEAVSPHSFETLACYQQAPKLFQAGYRLAGRLPVEERYNMADQIRRAALSTLLNIAEGYGRYHYLDKLRFFYQARGSMSETLSAFIGAWHAGYIDDVQLAWMRETENEAERAINGYINFIRSQQHGADEYGRKLLHDPGSDYEAGLLRSQMSGEDAAPDPRSLIPDPRSPVEHTISSEEVPNG